MLINFRVLTVSFTCHRRVMYVLHPVMSARVGYLFDAARTFGGIMGDICNDVY